MYMAKEIRTIRKKTHYNILRTPQRQKIQKQPARQKQSAQQEQQHQWSLELLGENPYRENREIEQ